MRRAAPRAKGGIGGGLGPIGRGALVSGDRDQGEPIDRAREPDRLTASTQKPSISARLRHGVQHHASNRQRDAPRNPQKSAIPPRQPDPAELEADQHQVEQLDGPTGGDRAPAAGRNAKSFARTRPQDGPAGQISRTIVGRASISTRQNIREPQKTATFEALGRGGSGAEPL